VIGKNAKSIGELKRKVSAAQGDNKLRGNRAGASKRRKDAKMC